MVVQDNNQIIKQSNEILDLLGDIQTFNLQSNVPRFIPSQYPDMNLKDGDMCFYKVDKLMYDEDYPRREAFENIISAFENPEFNVVYILESTGNNVDMYLGIVKNSDTKINRKSASREGELLKRLFEGNFSGSKLERLLSGKEGRYDLKKKIIESAKEYKSVGVISGIPTIDNGNEEEDFQGVDRLINSMLGLKWRLVIVCEPILKEEILELKDNMYEIYNRLSACSKYTMQISSNTGETFTNSSNSSNTSGKNKGYGFNKTEGETRSNDSGIKSSNKQAGYNEHFDVNSSYQEGKTVGYNQNRGKSQAVTFEIASKRIQEMMKYIDESLLERINVGYSKGLFKTSTYYMATNPDDADRLKASIMSVFQGSKLTFSPMVARSLDEVGSENIERIKCTYQNQFERNSNVLSYDIPLINCRPYEGKNIVGLGTYLTTKEISLIAGLPQKEVPGITLSKSANFGLNLKSGKSPKEDFRIGSIMHKDRVLEDLPYCLSKSSLAKHIFIAGVTGSGKTTTCHNLLGHAQIPFMVIEPAKTEYRALIQNKKYGDLLVLTLGDERIAPFRLNPFELIKGQNISSHIDMIKATFTSSFPMEASMPQILEEAIYKCYEKKGWDADTNENLIYGDKAFDDNVDSFPILSDLLLVMKEVVESKKFGAELKANYIGSLISRLSNLTVGSKGSMLNCRHSMDFRYLVKSNVIIEMEELKSPEDKSLFMGFILSKVSAVIKDEFKKKKQCGKSFRHITLIEEAHRLLSKPDFSDNGSKKMAVETFTDLLAEIRKYGESLIIVDQIPNKLAPEVLKNTNTKIIHKILAKDDKEVVGDTMLMDDKQKEHLSSMGPGEAVVFSENTDKPIHIKIELISDTNEDMILDESVRERYLELKQNLGFVYANIELEKHYKSFIRLFDGTRVADGRNFNIQYLSELRIWIENLAKEYNKKPKEIWTFFINRRDTYTGKNIQDIENEETRIKAIIDFYENALTHRDPPDELLSSYHNYF